MTKSITVFALIAALGLSACGTEDPPDNQAIIQAAEQFCASHEGVDPDGWEADGDATCNDGTDFESEGIAGQEELEGNEADDSSSKKKRKKRR